MPSQPPSPASAVRAVPAISVITPVYNGERYLEECIESVLAQTRGDWEHIIADNCSTDATSRIAQRYAAADPRIRYVRCEEFVGPHASFSRSIGFMHPESRWCKFLCADDRLEPDCLGKMVALAERHPSVGIVSAHRLYGDQVNTDKPLAAPRETMPGRDVIRSATLHLVHGTGSPTTVLFPAAVVRGHTPFFDESVYHSDVDAALRVLRQADFGFVHETLTFSRVHPDTITASFADRINTYVPLPARMVVRYGREVLSRTEYRQALRRRLRDYAWFLAKARLQPARRRDAVFQDYHRAELARLRAELPADDRETRLALRLMGALLRPARRTATA